MEEGVVVRQLLQAGVVVAEEEARRRPQVQVVLALVPPLEFRQRDFRLRSHARWWALPSPIE